MLDLRDIQGFVLRGYTLPHLRCFVLRVEDAAGARRFLGAISGRNEAAAPQITTSVPWPEKPDHCLNLGLTYDGLRALGLPEDSLRSFPEEFIAGALGRAAHIGDVGPNAPEHWRAGLNTPDTAHLIVWLYGQTPDARERHSARLRALFTAGGLAELSHHDADALGDHRFHFGYRDGLSQPTIQGGGAPWAGLDDPLPRVPPGAFLLGYPSQWRDFTYPVPSPPRELGLNGSFVAFRILRQDVDGFEAFLRESAPAAGMSVEKLAAKLMGRWRNGVPLALSPDTDTPDPPIPWERWNYFDYAPTDACPDGFDDRRGLRCPVGAHLRRVNPRSARIAGGGGHLHRVVRRGLPYGPPYDPDRPNDGIERGLLGVFICVSLKDQFEFLMREWVNDGAFAPGLGRTRDPLAGDNTPEDSRFVIPRESGPPCVLTGFSRFVTTCGSAYCFLPGVTALRYLSRLA